ncbi:hypothetical protein HG537_0D06150 [Torulaspora globosa]|uniref:Dihydroorotate dehydrogenase (quinone), mitochondrial n=1 Tax=Torulaspora globosa TaxID=48254 RepID=A0A7H9HS98_9SACH|nr:hypothetical protein HG537_0D06150 [Torulaspora sp. CBS 2947]
MFARNGFQVVSRRFIFGGNSGGPTLKSNVGAKSLLYAAGLVGASAACLYAVDARSAVHQYLLCPLIRLATPDAEQGHRFGIWVLKWGLAPKLLFDKDPESLHVEVFGKSLTNPIGCAAGLDKDAEAVDGIFATGFGYMEVGSVTPMAQPGNPKPRFFRLPQDGAVINRYGFNSAGHEEVQGNLAERVSRFLKSYFTDKNATENLSLYQDKLLAVNLGKNKFGDTVNDYLKGVEKFQSLADVLVVNVSSPNTPGLRNLQDSSKLTNLLCQVVAKRDSLIGEGDALGHSSHKPPILVKVAPDLSETELQSIVESAKKSKIDGIIVSNTTVQRPANLVTEEEHLRNQAGGLSGKPLKPIALNALKSVAKYAKGSGLVLVGCGGISNGKDAIEFAKAGATFVQLYTAFAYAGPGLVAKIKDEVAEELSKEGKTWTEIIGQDID